MIRLFISCFGLITFFVPSVYAQFHFVPATVQLLKGDTLHGWIDETGLKNVPYRIRYKQYPDASESTFYYAHMISGFNIINGAGYQSYVGNVDSSHVIVLHKKTNPKPAQIADTLFLQLLAEGRISLLYAPDRRGVPHYFLWKENNIPEELHYFRFISYSEGSTRGMYTDTQAHRTDKKLYKQQMLAAFADNKPLYEKLAEANVRFTRRDLIKWFNEYNKSELKVTAEEPSKQNTK